LTCTLTGRTNLIELLPGSLGFPVNTLQGLVYTVYVLFDCLGGW
jgi:hypothetical protein